MNYQRKKTSHPDAVKLRTRASRYFMRNETNVNPDGIVEPATCNLRSEAKGPFRGELSMSHGPNTLFKSSFVTCNEKG